MLKLNNSNEGLSMPVKDEKNRLKKTKSKAASTHHIKPMLAYLVDQPFDNEKWLFEIKWDGYRALAYIDGTGHVELYSRNFQSFNEKYPEISQELANLNYQATFDGEIVIVDKSGHSNFQALQGYQTIPSGNLRYYIFDLLSYQNEDLRHLPLIERKKILQKLLKKTHSSRLQYSDHVLNHGKRFFEEAKNLRLEGIMAKEIDSSYISSRSRQWLKIKTHATQEAIICGFTEPKGSRESFGALILGVYINKKLTYVGHVGGGFNRKLLKDIMNKLTPLINNKCPFEEIPKTNTPVTWVQPKLVCDVSHGEWTQDNRLRQPIFKGLRTDKTPQEVVKEKAITAKPSNNNTTKKSSSHKNNKEADNTQIKQKEIHLSKTYKDLQLTNLDKIYWLTDGYTKGDLIEYYAHIAPFILPYLKDRPQSLHRFPNGIEASGFYQKNMPENLPSWLTTCSIESNGKQVRYLIINDEPSLLYAVNLGCIDMNPFNSRVQHLDFPDYAIIDLDPEAITFDSVIKTALTIHEILESASIPNYIKTSGATGMHIYIPTGAKYSHEQCKKFIHLIAELTYQQLPEITSIERKPKLRQKKVYLDYLQNNLGQTLATPYSVRPKQHATVSTPLLWSEVKEGLDPTHFTIKNTLQRIKKYKDLFADVLGKGIDMNKCLRRLK